MIMNTTVPQGEQKSPTIGIRATTSGFSHQQPYLSSYIVSKAAMSAYTRILAKKYPSFCVNCLCPGYCKTDITTNTGIFTASEGAENAVRLALLPEGGPSGCFFYQKQMPPCF
jgi:(+)-neomenthol dehydrogenase